MFASPCYRCVLRPGPGLGRGGGLSCRVSPVSNCTRLLEVVARRDFGRGLTVARAAGAEDDAASLSLASLVIARGAAGLTAEAEGSVASPPVSLTFPASAEGVPCRSADVGSCAPACPPAPPAGGMSVPHTPRGHGCAPDVRRTRAAPVHTVHAAHRRHTSRYTHVPALKAPTRGALVKPADVIRLRAVVGGGGAVLDRAKSPEGPPHPPLCPCVPHAPHVPQPGLCLRGGGGGGAGGWVQPPYPPRRRWCPVFRGAKSAEEKL